ncbi:hypothetical protein BKN38_01690 [Helicobacter sp. CLO-3]|nr:hypothetical protein BKN38_01690 [Helicobacter sp. CLO-3]
MLLFVEVCIIFLDFELYSIWHIIIQKLTRKQTINYAWILPKRLLLKNQHGKSQNLKNLDSRF